MRDFFLYFSFSSSNQEFSLLSELHWGDSTTLYWLVNMMHFNQLSFLVYHALLLYLPVPVEQSLKHSECLIHVTLISEDERL